jgi:hypothetical protein
LAFKILGLEISLAKKKELPEPQHTVNAELNDLASMWNITDDRKTIYTDCKRMVDTDEYAAEARDALTSDILPIKNFHDDYILTESDDDYLKKNVRRVIDMSGIRQQLKNIIPNYLTYGNRHAEFLTYPNRKFAGIQEIPQTWSVYRNIDDHGRLKDGDPALKRINTCAYDQRDDAGGFKAGFYPYQIIHWRAAPFDKYGNGTPFLQAARHNWLKMQYSEDSLRRARIVRAFMKFAHFIPISAKATNEQRKQRIKEYKESIQKKDVAFMEDGVLRRKLVANPVDVDTDYFFLIDENTKGDLKMFDPTNAQLQNLADMEYALNRFFARLKVPKARLANEKDVRAKATMGEINTAYASTITGFQIDIITPIYDMVNRALFLDGIISDIDERVKYKLILPSPFVKDDLTRARIENIESAIVKNYVGSHAFSRDTMRQRYGDMSDKESAEEEIKVLGEKDKFPAPMKGLMASDVIPPEKILRELQALKDEVAGNGQYSNRLAYRR